MGGGGFSTLGGRRAARALHRRPARAWISRASACCPRRAGIPTTRSTASTARSAGSAGSRTSRSSGSAPTRCRPREHLLAQDVIYVGGGSLANLLAIWRVHGLDDTLPRGVGARDRALRGQRGLDVLVRGRRHPLARALAAGPGPRAAAGQQLGAPLERPGAAGLLPRRRAGRPARPGYAVDDGVGLLFAGTELVEVVSARPDARAYAVEELQGALVETPIAPRLLAPLGGRGARRPGGDRRVPRRAQGAPGARPPLAARLM